MGIGRSTTTYHAKATGDPNPVRALHRSEFPTRPTFQSFFGALIVLAAPGGCIMEPVVTGHLELYNRTTETLIIRAEHGREILVEPCEALVRDDFPLNGVSGEAQSGNDAVTFEYGVDVGPLIILVTPEGTDVLAASPTRLPVCGGGTSPQPSGARSPAQGAPT